MSQMTNFLDRYVLHFCALCLLGLTYCAGYFFIHGDQMVKKSLLDSPIEVTYLDKEYYRNKSQRYNIMIVLFNSKEYRVSITRKEFNNIDKGILPNLYYYEKQDCIFGNWTIQQNYRIGMISVLGILVFLLMAPYLAKKYSRV